MEDRLELKEIIWQVVKSIPSGSVATYGLVAKLSGYGSHARYVGYVLKRLPEGTQIPWHRVVNAKGEIAFDQGSRAYMTQRARLEAEGIKFNGANRIALSTYLFR